MIFNLLDAQWPGSIPTPTPTGFVLYDSGDEKTSVTGGWSTFAPAWAGNGYTFLAPAGQGAELVYGTNPINGTGTKGSDYLKIYFREPDRSSQWINTAFGTENLIDLSGWSTLHVQATVVEKSTTPYVVSSYCAFGVTDSKTPPTDGTHTPPGTYKELAVGENTLDISELNDSQYIYFAGEIGTYAHGGEAERHIQIVVTKIWLT